MKKIIAAQSLEIYYKSVSNQEILRQKSSFNLKEIDCLLMNYETSHFSKFLKLIIASLINVYFDLKIVPLLHTN